MENSRGIKRTLGTCHSQQDNDEPALKRCKPWGPPHGVLRARAGARVAQAGFYGSMCHEVGAIDDWQRFSLAQMLLPWPPKAEPAVRPHHELPLGNRHVWTPRTRELRTVGGETVALNKFSLNVVGALVKAKGRRLPKEVLAKKAGFPQYSLGRYLCGIRKVIPDLVDYNMDGYRIAMRPVDMDGPIMACGPLNLHLDQRTVARGGEFVGLRDAEFSMLQSLLESHENVLISQCDLRNRMCGKSTEIPRKRNVLRIFRGMATKLADLLTLSFSRSKHKTCYGYSHLKT